MAAALSLALLAAPTAGAAFCPKAGVAAANVANKRKSHRLCMSNSLSWFSAKRLRRGANCLADDTVTASDPARTSGTSRWQLAIEFTACAKEPATPLARPSVKCLGPPFGSLLGDCDRIKWSVARATGLGQGMALHPSKTLSDLSRRQTNPNGVNGTFVAHHAPRVVKRWTAVLYRASTSRRDK